MLARDTRARPTTTVRGPWTSARGRRTGLALALASAILAGCGGGSTADTVSADEIGGAPKRYYVLAAVGEAVTIEAQTSRRIDHRVWEMGGGRLFVIFDRGIDPAPGPGDALRVSGTVYPLQKAVIEGELGVNIEDRFFTDASLSDNVAIVADEVARIG